MQIDYLYHRPSMIRMHRARTRLLHRDEIRIATGSYLPIEQGQIWRHRRARSVARHLHTWSFYYSLRPFHDRQDEAVLRRLMDLLRTWRDAVGLPPTRIPMSYHDEATAQRVIALTCLLQDYQDHLTSADRDLVLQVVREGAELMEGGDFYSGGTNHGMYQDLALLAASIHLPKGERLATLGLQRLTDYFTTAFTADAIHREQSPEYHVQAIVHLRRFIDLIADERPETAQWLRETVERAAVYAVMSISPVGTFAPVSDVTAQPVAASGFRTALNSPEYRYAVTQGVQGTAPDLHRLVAEDTGVAIFREDWSDPDSLYLYVSAAYTSDYHKHSDDLSVYLVHRGQELLREAGPNGYQRDDPFTEYAYSSFAHNTLVVDGRSLPRIEPGGGEKVGLADRGATAEVPFSVSGWNHRWPGVEHRRDVSVHLPVSRRGRRQVRIIDQIRADSDRGLQLLWHLGPEIEATIDGSVIRLTDSRRDRALAEMRIRSDRELSISLVSGREEPTIQGWYFPDYGVHRPAPVVEVSLTASTADVHTDITLL